ncbi:MAG TPA: STAS domain-containing protein [Actinomycetota bacterium]|nr:STAS domain-containing protein [Actinomycetota bacterium]
MSTEFLITLTYDARAITLACAGELDIATARKLRDAIELSIEQQPLVFTLDAQGISLLTSSGIEVLLDAVNGCRSNGIKLDLRLSRSSRRILDMVGLWWVGVVEEVPASDPRDGLKTYSELRHTPEFESILDQEREADR